MTAIKPERMWAVVDGHSWLGALAIDTQTSIPMGTNFFALFYMRKFAVEAARNWNKSGGKARVVRVIISEAPTR